MNHCLWILQKHSEQITHPHNFWLSLPSSKHLQCRMEMSEIYTIKETIVLFFYFWFLIRYFLYFHFKCYPESPLYPPPTLLLYQPTPTSWPWHSPVLGHIKFVRPRGLSSQIWPTRPSSATYAARDMSSGSTG
jgi:hypothetical protein